MNSQNSLGLNRSLGLVAGICINVANTIGTGVFLKARVMTCNVGDPWWVMVVWLAAGLLSLAGAFCYAELAAMLPAAGGEFVFLRRAYGRPTCSAGRCSASCVPARKRRCRWASPSS